MLTSASRLIFKPGAITPPTYSLFLLTISIVVAVPRSTIITGLPTFSIPPTEFAIRSGPSSLGLSIITDKPVLTPGPKTKARYWSCYQWRAGAKVDN